MMSLLGRRDDEFVGDPAGNAGVPGRWQSEDDVLEARVDGLTDLLANGAGLIVGDAQVD
jgi:hypothetical protein